METAAKNRNKIPEAHQPACVVGSGSNCKTVHGQGVKSKFRIMKNEVKNGVNGTADKNAKLTGTNSTAKKDEKEFLQDRPNEELQFAIPRTEAESAKLKPALNLDETLKLVEQLYHKRNQRDKLLDTITNLEKYEIDQQETADETGNTFNSSELTIEDDKGRTFTTKNPIIIGLTTLYIKNLCRDRLAEIEAEIILP